MLDFIPTRVVLSIVSFFGFMNLYLTRYSFSLISVSMITPPSNVTCKNDLDDCKTNSLERNTFDWDENVRAILLSSFTYGYCLTQIIGGRLAELHGAKIVLGCSIIFPAFLGFLMPKAAEISYWCLTVLRFVQGMFQGMSWPSMMALVTLWIPPHERSRFMSIVLLSASLSIVWILPFSGYLCDVYSWQASLYIVSVPPIIWGFFWFALVHRNPSSHPRITPEEREYIERCVREGGSSDGVMTSVPWKSIFTSVPMLAIIVMDIGNSVSFGIFTYQLPNYLKFAFNFDLAQTGFLSGLPFLCRYIGAVLFSFIADFLISCNILEIATTRRIFSITCLMLPAFVLGVNILFGMTNVVIFVSLTCIYMFFNGSIGSSQLSNFGDIAPNYAGTLMGISNTIGNAASFLSIMATGEILNGGESIGRWKIVFGSCIPLMVVTVTFYILFLKGSPQPWNFHQEQRDISAAEDDEDEILVSN